jgi:hypothetical protein
MVKKKSVKQTKDADAKKKRSRRTKPKINVSYCDGKSFEECEAEVVRNEGDRRNKKIKHSNGRRKEND